jgi:hypothetical protein
MYNQRSLSTSMLPGFLGHILKMQTLLGPSPSDHVSYGPSTTVFTVSIHTHFKTTAITQTNKRKTNE